MGRRGICPVTTDPDSHPTEVGRRTLDPDPRVFFGQRKGRFREESPISFGASSRGRSGETVPFPTRP